MTLERRIDYFCLDSTQFRKISTIKKGAYGSIYLVEEEETKNKYAAKQMIDFSNYENHKYFVRELDIFMRVANSCIIGFKGFSFNFDNSDIPTIFLELAEGGSVQSKLKAAYDKKPDPKWTPTKRMISLIGVAYGMMQLHKNNVIHRDLKPDNVLLDINLYPKITDFGLSKFENKTLEQSCSCVGTPLYMAPEAISGTNFTNSIDVYSFAIMAYEIITLKPAYSYMNETVFKILAKVSTGARPIIQEGEMNENLKSLLETCWSENPSERYTFEQITTCLFNKDYSIPDVDEEELGNYIKILKNDYESTNDTQEATQKIKLADAGDIPMMKTVADNYFDGINGFSHDECKALYYYRLFSMNVGNLGDDHIKKQIPLQNELPTSEPIVPAHASPFLTNSYETPQKRTNKSFREARAKTLIIKSKLEFDTKEKIDFIALTQRALQLKITNYNIIIYGTKLARTPIIRAFGKNQILSHEELTPNFKSHRIYGCSVSLYEATNIGQISEDSILNFIKEKSSSKCPPEERVKHCIYCLFGDEDSILTDNDERIIKSMSKNCLTAIFILHSTNDRFKDKIIKHLPGSYILEEAMINIRNAKKGPCILTIPSDDENLVFQKLQKYVNFVPSIL